MWVYLLVVEFALSMATASASPVKKFKMWVPSIGGRPHASEAIKLAFEDLYPAILYRGGIAYPSMDMKVGILSHEEAEASKCTDL